MRTPWWLPWAPWTPGETWGLRGILVCAWVMIASTAFGVACKVMGW